MIFLFNAGMCVGGGGGYRPEPKISSPDIEECSTSKNCLYYDFRTYQFVCNIKILFA